MDNYICDISVIRVLNIAVHGNIQEAAETLVKGAKTNPQKLAKRYACLLGVTYDQFPDKVDRAIIVLKRADNILRGDK